MRSAPVASEMPRGRVGGVVDEPHASKQLGQGIGALLAQRVGATLSQLRARLLDEVVLD